MKDFVKTTLAVLCGFFIVGIILFIGGLGFIGTHALAGSGSQPVLPKEGVLAIDFHDITIGEQTLEDNPMQALQGNAVKTIGILDAVRALKVAAEDPAVKFIYLRPEGASMGMAHMEEFRDALAECRKAGKPVIAYMTNIHTGGYYLATAADKIYATSYSGGTNIFNGISGQLYFLKDLLDKLGVNVQLIRHGKYKSAGEMYVRSSASDANLEQNRAMISSIWHSLASEMAESRGISEARLNELIDGLALNDTEDFLREGLVDALYTREELKEQIATLALKDSYKDVRYIDFTDYVEVKNAVPASGKRDKIAIIYANGEIVESASASMSGGASQVAGPDFASIIADVRADSTVKAVVFRVNSPGGSVLASEQIRAEIELTRKDKPVVASYGAYAASGGYWISAGSDRIFSDATTLTGSIGVFSMIPDFSKTVKNIAHVTLTPVNSNDHADMYGLMRPLDAKETAYMQGSVEDIYTRFVSVVSEGRGLESGFVDSIAQGRVWTGSDALGIGLVDEIGTLDDAVRYAAGLVDGRDAASFELVGYPAPPSLMNQLMAMLGGYKDDSNLLAGTPFEDFGVSVRSWLKSWDRGNRQTMFARMPYDLEISF